MTEPGEAEELPVKGSETAPFLYVEEFWGASWYGGVVKFRLVRSRRSNSDENYLEEVAVLAMSAESLANAHQFIGTIIEKMKETGDYVEERPGDRQ